MCDVTAASSADVSRLTALIARQRRELDRMRAQAAARSVVDIAQGILMERLGCPAAEAAGQLSRLARQAGLPLAELAAEVTGQRLAAMPEPEDDGDPGWRRLSLASAAVVAAADGDAIAAGALEQALAPAGAVAVALWLVGPDGSLELAGQAGLGEREAGRWQHIPPAMDCLPQRVAREGTDLFWPAGPPERDPVPLLGCWRGGARAVLPMRVPGAPAGVLEACWPAPLPEFPPSLRRQLTGLADLCARALSADGDGPPGRPAAWLYALLDGVIESAMFAHPVRDAGGAVTDFRIGHVSADFRDPAGRKAADLAGRPLLEVYPLAALAGGLFDRAVEVLTTGEPRHLSGGISALVTDAGVAPVMDIRIAPLFDGVVVAWRPIGEAERLASLLQHAERLGRIGGWEENLLTGEVRWTESAFALFGRDRDAGPVPLAELHGQVMADDMFDIEQFRDTLLREKKATAAAFRILRDGDQSVRQMRVFGEPVMDAAGSLASVRGAFQDVSAHYHTQVALTATRDHLASTEERAKEEHRLALRLQQAITPRSAAPVAAAGLDVAARYRPAGPAYLVSGDWYDTVLLPSRQVLLVVGDIAGHGIDAVTGMVALRNCLRGLAITGAGPASLLSWLNRVACHLTDGIIGTAVCGLYDPGDRTLRWALAGHLPPVLVRDGQASELPSGQGLLLGADPDAEYEEVTTSLQPGDALLLFTDGLIERRDQAIDDAQATLLRHASRPVGPIAEYADHLLRNAASDTGDDACLVAVRVR
jgi:serine phosphatase RsbU (regulator of sigma subunit)/PAS domain-containing protein